MRYYMYSLLHRLTFREKSHLTTPNRVNPKVSRGVQVVPRANPISSQRFFHILHMVVLYVSDICVHPSCRGSQSTLLDLPRMSLEMLTLSYSHSLISPQPQGCFECDIKRFPIFV